MLNYNTTNPLDLPSDNNKKSITPEVSNNGDSKQIKAANISHNKEDIRQADIN